VNWNEFKHAEKVYDLKHLRSYTTRFEWLATAKKASEKISVTITFSHHCFTRGLPRDAGPYDPTLRFDHEGDTRIFDVELWELSRRLPDILSNLASMKCMQTGKSNFLAIEMVAADGSKCEYEIYFRVWKPRKRNVSLHVESAYVREENYGSSRPKGTAINFRVVLHNTLHDIAIRF
jgi:hypothetical protein